MGVCDGPEGGQGRNALATPYGLPQILGTSPPSSDSAGFLCSLGPQLSVGHDTSVGFLRLIPCRTKPLVLPNTSRLGYHITAKGRASGLPKHSQRGPNDAAQKCAGLTPHGTDFDQREIRDGRETDRYIQFHPSFHPTAPRDS